MKKIYFIAAIMMLLGSLLSFMITIYSASKNNFNEMIICLVLALIHFEIALYLKKRCDNA